VKDLQSFADRLRLVRWRRVAVFYGLTLTLTTAAIYTWLRERSQSIFVPAVFHGTCGGTSLVAIAFVHGSDELLSGFTGLAGLVSAAAGCALALAFPRSSIGR
jgi:membrane protease YdiL (CAAX protease family)